MVWEPILGEIGTSFGKIPRKRASRSLDNRFYRNHGDFLRAFSHGRWNLYRNWGRFQCHECHAGSQKVQTGKRTMVYLAVSLAVTAAGLLFCYALFPLNLLRAEPWMPFWRTGPSAAWYLGGTLALVTSSFGRRSSYWSVARPVSLNGPRVMANMAVDSWLPRRFSALSNDSPCRTAFLLMGAASLAVLFYTHGSVSALVVMYSINVFLTFSLSQFGMAKFFFQNRNKDKAWARHIVIHLIGLVLCVTILIVTIYWEVQRRGVGHTGHHVSSDWIVLSDSAPLPESTERRASTGGNYVFSSVWANS